MNIRHLENQGKNEEGLTSFYISFGDLMVLLAAFFVMLIGMSRIEIGSFEKIRSGFTGSTTGTLVELAADLDRIVNSDPGVPGVKVRLDEDGVRLDLETAALFASASAHIKEGSLVPLKPLLNRIKRTSYTLDIEGHTDDKALYRMTNGELETNWSLSGRRASSVVHHLLSFGFFPSRLRIVGYASTRPRVSLKGKSFRERERARNENRRVSILIR